MEKYTYSNIQPEQTTRPSLERSYESVKHFLRYWYADRMDDDYILERMQCSGYHYLVGFDPLLPVEDAYNIVMAAVDEIFPEKEETV